MIDAVLFALLWILRSKPLYTSSDASLTYVHLAYDWLSKDCSFPEDFVHRCWSLRYPERQVTDHPPVAQSVDPRSWAFLLLLLPLCKYSYLYTCTAFNNIFIFSSKKLFSRNQSNAKCDLLCYLLLYAWSYMVTYITWLGISAACLMMLLLGHIGNTTLNNQLIFPISFTQRTGPIYVT